MKIFPLWLFAFCALPLLAFGQGPLTPPAAPTPTMKTLDQIEARTPIPSAAVGLVPPFSINQSGSYYLTTNIAVTSGNAIQTLANARNITIDLNGFTISSSASPASGNAILLNGSPSNITIRNGFISGTTTVSGSTFSGGGFVGGINGGSATNITVERISIQGINGEGIFAPGPGSVVRSCSTNVTGGQGINATLITNSTAEAAGGSQAMFGTTVSGCRATNVSAVANSIGIGATLCTDSTGTSTTGAGIQTVSGVNCAGTSTNSAGLIAIETATNCGGTTASTLASVFGLDCAGGTATGCWGKGGGGSSGALRAGIAIGCTFLNGTASIGNRYNMP